MGILGGLPRQCELGLLSTPTYDEQRIRRVSINLAGPAEQGGSPGAGTGPRW